MHNLFRGILNFISSFYADNQNREKIIAKYEIDVLTS